MVYIRLYQVETMYLNGETKQIIAILLFNFTIVSLKNGIYNKTKLEQEKRMTKGDFHDGTIN